MRRFIKKLVAMVPILVVLVLLVVLASPVSAATTADVAVNATPSFVSITNSPDNYGFGTVVAGSNVSTAQAYFTMVDGSSVNIDVAISCNATWAGGVTWTHDDTGTPGVDTAALKASPNTGAYDIIVKNGTPVNLVANNSGNVTWELRLYAPTSFGDGVLKTNTVTLTATAT